MRGFEDLLNNVVIAQLKDPDSYTVSSDVDCASIDHANVGEASHIIPIGDIAEYSTAHHTSIRIEDSADDSTFAAVTDLNAITFKIGDTITTPETIASGFVKLLDNTADQNKVYTVAYHGQKRYSRISMDVTGTRTTMDFGVVGMSFRLARKGASAVLGAN